MEDNLIIVLNGRQPNQSYANRRQQLVTASILLKTFVGLAKLSKILYIIVMMISMILFSTNVSTNNCPSHNLVTT
jgi:hypothetical protein